MLQRSFILILCISAHCIISIGQEPVESIFQSHLEDNFEAEGTDFLPVLEHLNQLSQNPLDINTLTYDELMQLGFLSAIQAEYILTYRSRLGDFMDIHELQAVPEIDLNTALLLSHVVRVDSKNQYSPVSFRNLLLFGKSELLIRARTFLEEDILAREVEKNERPYFGNHHHYMLRYRYNFDNRILLSYLGEKDPGETLYHPRHTFGPDFNSASLAFMNAGKFIDMAVLGDFTVHLGQGLVSNASYGGGKSGSVMQISKTGKNLRPYGSVNEQGFFRGLAVSGRIKNWNYMVFGSVNPFDANMDTLTEADGKQSSAIRTIQLTGFHRDSTELISKQNVFLWNYGGRLGMMSRAYRIHLNFLGNHYQYPFSPPDEMYQKFKFTQKNILNYSMDYSVKWKNMLFTGESAFMNAAATANLHMIQMSLASKLDVSVLYRNYQTAYEAPFSNGFAESNGTSNEWGLYIGSVFRMNKQVRIEAYLDIWNNGWLKYGVDHPGYGFEYFIKWEYSVRKKMHFYLLYKSELKTRNSSLDPVSLNDIESLRKTNWRFHVAYKMSQTVELRNRAEWTLINQDKRGYGFLVFQDLIYKPMNSALSVTARLAYFDINNWDNRIYAYENDLLYAFSIPAYYRKGFRVYGNLRFKPFRNWVLEARIARTYLPFEVLEDLGNYHHKTELKLQLKYSF